MSDTRTLGDMISRITREIRRDGLTADIRHSIVAAIESVEQNRFWFNEGQATATAATGVQSVSLPLAFIEEDEIFYEDSSSARFVLRNVHWEDLVQRDRNTTGDPLEYAIHHDEIHLWPATDDLFVLRIDGLHELTEISASASSGSANAWTQEAESLIRPLAKADLFAGRLRNSERAGEQLALANAALRRLMQRTTQQISSGKLRKTSF